MKQIYLSPPHMGDQERDLLIEAFDSNWIAPLGPHVDAFEREFAAVTGASHAAALSSGTAALHLAVRMLGIGAGDEVLCSTLTFAASVNPVLYEGARPVFIDSDEQSWNMDPALLAQELDERAASGRLPKAVILTHIYGQSADLDPIAAACARYEVPLIEDACESLGAEYKGRHPGNDGVFGAFSFNGNKIITTSGGGMLVAGDGASIDRARKLSTQAREPAPHYEHAEVGFNYRMSNLLAAVGRGQLQSLQQRVTARRRNYAFYAAEFGQEAGIRFMPEARYGKCTRWLTVMTVDAVEFGASREQIRLHLDELAIESRPVWKPMHLQPAFRDFPVIGGKVSERQFEQGLCLPSGSQMSAQDLNRVAEALRTTPRHASATT